MKRINLLSVKILNGESLISRRFSTITKPISNPANINFISDKDRMEFDDSYGKIFDLIVKQELMTPIQKVNKKLANILNYNVPVGKKMRPHLLIATYKFITSDRKYTQDSTNLLYILAWCYEMMNAAYIIHDDIVDNTAIRRGKPTWFKHEKVGLTAINDSVLLERTCNMLIKNFFSSAENYHKIQESFLNICRDTRIGQILESETTCFNEFTEERYNQIAEFKMGRYSFYYPILLGTLLADREDLMESKMVEDVIRELGYFYTIQNDFLDCYGEDILKKQGTDIQENRCTWLVLTALQRATFSQKKILEECYGSYSDEKVNQVKKIYEELNIHNEYQKIEKNFFDRVLLATSKIDNNLMRPLMKKIVMDIFQETKE